MPQLREEKKREILDYLESHAEGDRLLPLDQTSLVNEFADETYDPSDVEKLVDELEGDGLLVKQTARMEVVYPTGSEESIEERFEHLFESTSTFATFFVGIVLYSLLIEWPPFFDIIYESGLSPSQTVTRFAVSGLIGAYVLGRAAFWFLFTTQEHFEVIREYRPLVYPTLAIAAISTGIAIGYTNYTSSVLETNHVLQIIGISIAGGIAVGKLFLDK